MPSVGVRVGEPETAGCVKVGNGAAAPSVAVAGVVLRLGSGVSVLTMGTVVLVAEDSARGGVAVSGTIVAVGEG